VDVAVGAFAPQADSISMSSKPTNNAELDELVFIGFSLVNRMDTCSHYRNFKPPIQ
jgi:hypothetical protein